MLFDVTLLDLKEKAERGDFNAQMEMCDAFLMGHRSQINDKEAIRFATLSLSHPQAIVESNGYDYDGFLWIMGKIFTYLNKPFDALLCYRKAVKYIQETYTTESSERLIKNYELSELIDAIVPPQTYCLFLNGKRKFFTYVD